MKQIFTLALGLFSLSVAATTGGPDAYGYTWIDSNEPGGPAYSWYNNIGTADGFLVSGLADDNVVGPFNFTVPFQYYWYSVDKFYIGSNGYIAFNNTNIASPFPTAIPSTAAGHNFIAGLMSDLNFSGAGNPGQVWVTLGQDSTIITYVDVPFWNQATNFAGSNTFQIIFTNSDSSITVNYQSQTGTTNNNDIAIGIENLTGGIGLEHSLDTYPANNYTVRYEYPSNVTYQVTDAGVEWGGTVGNKGRFISKDGPQYNVIGKFTNSGNQPLGSFQVNADVYTQGGVNVFTDNATIPSLSAGADTIVNFGTSYTPNTAGTYYLQTAVVPPPGDATPSNNSRRTEIVVVDTTQSLIDLKYTDNTNEGSLGWSGGNGGVAMYFKPPSYPARINYTSYFITADANSVGFHAMIYADDGPNNTHGTLLDSVYVPSSALTFNTYNNVQTTAPINITSGGVYVRWEMAGDGINLGTDLTAPISRHAVEVLGNTWAAYRSFETTDFMISVGYELDLPLDMQVTKIVSPAPGTIIAAPTTVTVTVKNVGSGTLSSFPLGYQIGGGAIVSENYNGVTLNPGDSADFSFATQLTPPDGGQLCAFTQLVNDVDPSNDESCTQVTGLSIDEAFEKVKLYPIPASDQLHVGFDGDIRVINLEGRIVLEENIQMNQALEISNLAPGVYYMQFNQEERWLGKQKFIVY